MKSAFERWRFEAAVVQRGIERIGLDLSRVLGRPGHGDEQRGTLRFRDEFSVAFAHQVEHLLVARSDGDDDQASFPQLIDQRLGHALRRTGDDDLVEGGMFRPALKAVADLHVHVAVAQAFERALRGAAERFDDFDGVDILDQAAEHGRLVSAARADLQHAIGRLRIDRFGHEGDDERGRDGLLVADRQSHVFVGQLARRARHELVARRAAHGVDHPRVLHSGVDDRRGDHPLAGRVQLRAGLSWSGS